jgi:hypothetical protein
VISPLAIPESISFSTMKDGSPYIFGSPDPSDPFLSIFKGLFPPGFEYFSLALFFTFNGFGPLSLVLQAN